MKTDDKRLILPFSIELFCKSCPMTKILLALLLMTETAFAAPISHEAVYSIGLASTAGGADSVVGANGTMHYKAQKKCALWETETVFSLDVSRELAGVETTHWKQTTVESLDGCRFDFTVYVRENGRDRKELSGRALCENGKKRLFVDYPVAVEADFPKTVKFPLEQTVAWLDAAQKGQKSFTSYVFDGTRADALMAMNAVVSERDAKTKSRCFDFAFYPVQKGRNADGTPLYESSARYYDNGVADDIRQDFGTYVLQSTLKSFKRLKDIPCERR